LLDRVRAGGEPASVSITGPLRSENGGRRLHVRLSHGS
jgi:hypothetical protein